MRVTLLGTGDTVGTPRPDCECQTCQTASRRGIDRTRFSIHVRNERTGQTLLIDASPDLRHQFLREEVDLPDAVIITHVHYDHLGGLGNLYRLVDNIDVHASGRTDEATGNSVADTVRDRYRYLDPVTVRAEVPRTSFDAAGFSCQLLPVNHPPLDGYGLLVAEGESTLAITGDTSYNIPSPTQQALSGADLLIADAIAPASVCSSHPAGGQDTDETGVPRTFGTKHMTKEGALDLAATLDPNRKRLVHASHLYPPEEAFSEPLALDGEVFEL